MVVVDDVDEPMEQGLSVYSSETLNLIMMMIWLLCPLPPIRR